MKFQKVSRDANHKEIKDDLIKRGYAVIDLAGVGNSVPDLLVCRKVDAVTVLIEVKMTGKTIYLHQLKFGCEWPGYYGFAETIEDALALIVDPETNCLNYIEKAVGLEIVEEWLAKTIVTKKSGGKPQIRIGEFERQLQERSQLRWKEKIRSMGSSRKLNEP